MQISSRLFIFLVSLEKVKGEGCICIKIRAVSVSHMGKVFHFATFLIPLTAIVLSLSVISCSKADPFEETQKSFALVEPTTKVGNTFKSFMALTLETSEKVVKTLSEYDEVVSTKSVLSATDGSMDIKTILQNLPDDLQQVTRVKKVEVASGDKRTMSTEVVTLEDELVALEQEYNAAVEAIKPSVEDAAKLEYVTKVDNETVQIGGDMIFKSTDMSGAITIELMGASARGEDVDRVLADMGIVSDSVIGKDVATEDVGNNEGTVSAQGVYEYDTYKWWDNSIPYTFSPSMDPVHKQAVTNAMNEWMTKTSNAIQFYPCPSWGLGFWILLVKDACLSKMKLWVMIQWAKRHWVIVLI